MAGIATAPARRALPARRGIHAPRRPRRVARRNSGTRLNPLRARVGRLADGLLRGRLWVGVISVLLVGIVFFNVGVLQLNKGIAGSSQKAAALKRENAQLRLKVARLGSSERIQEAAAARGLVLPAPGQVRYLKASPLVDARRAAKRIDRPFDSQELALRRQAAGPQGVPAGTPGAAGTAPGAAPAPAAGAPAAAPVQPQAATPPAPQATPPAAAAPPAASPQTSPQAAAPQTAPPAG